MTLVLLTACSSASEPTKESVTEPKPAVDAPKDKSESPAKSQDGWIDYTPKYLWAYSSQFHQGFQNIKDPERIDKAVQLINEAPLVESAKKQANWGLLQFATGEMQIHFSKEEQAVYLFFGGQIRKTNDEILKVLGIEELRGR
jgi:hypothetical protein